MLSYYGLLRSLTCDTCNAYQAFICGGLGNVNFCLSSFSSQFPKELDNVVTQIFSEIDHFPLAVNNSADSYIFKYPSTKATWFLKRKRNKTSDSPGFEPDLKDWENSTMPLFQSLSHWFGRHKWLFEVSTFNFLLNVSFFYWLHHAI